MALHLIRHAEAVDETHELTDESRYLTERGRADARALGVALARLGVTPTALVSSPLVRAVQTAELVGASLAPHLAITVHEALAPGRSLRRLLAEIPALEGALLFGHEPSISALAAHVTDRTSFPAFHKAQAVLLDGGAARAWLMPRDEAWRPFHE